MILIIQMFIVVYFVGMYWFVFVDVIMNIMNPPASILDDDEPIVDNFFSKFDIE